MAKIKFTGGRVRFTGKSSLNSSGNQQQGPGEPSYSLTASDNADGSAQIVVSISNAPDGTYYIWDATNSASVDTVTVTSGSGSYNNSYNGDGSTTFELRTAAAGGGSLLATDTVNITSTAPSPVFGIKLTDNQNGTLSISAIAYNVQQPYYIYNSTTEASILDSPGFGFPATFDGTYINTDYDTGNGAFTISIKDADSGSNGNIIIQDVINVTGRSFGLTVTDPVSTDGLLTVDPIIIHPKNQATYVVQVSTTTTSTGFWDTVTTRSGNPTSVLSGAENQFVLDLTGMTGVLEYPTTDPAGVPVKLRIIRDVLEDPSETVLASLDYSAFRNGYTNGAYYMRGQWTPLDNTGTGWWNDVLFSNGLESSTPTISAYYGNMEWAGNPGRYAQYLLYVGNIVGLSAADLSYTVPVPDYDAYGNYTGYTTYLQTERVVGPGTFLAHYGTHFMLTAPLANNGQGPGTDWVNGQPTLTVYLTSGAVINNLFTFINTGENH